jgi:hypothetical protein
MQPLRTRPLRAAVAAAVLAVLACESGDPTGPLQITGVTVTGPANTVEVSSTLQLQATVLPDGVPQGVTWSTTDAALATVDNTGLVLGVGPGSVTVTATSTSDVSKSGSMQLDVTGCPAPRVVSANPTGDTTWENWIASPDCFDYVVSTVVNMQSGVLTIAPGTNVGFEAGRYMRIAGTAGLAATGTQQLPIVLTGTEQTPGHWGGVLLDNSSHAPNRIWYTTISYAGVNPPLSGSIVRANLMIVGGTTELAFTTLEHSALYGLFMNASADLGAGGENVFTRNQQGSVYTFASVADQIVRAVPTNSVGRFTGNTRDVFDVVPDVIDGTARWYDIGVPYRVVQGVNRLAFQVHGELTLTAGVTVEFEQDMGLLVRGGGRLEAIGTAAMPVTLTGSDRTPGHWRGVGMQDTDSRLEHVIIEYGGGAIIGLGEQRPANLQLTTGAATTPTQVRISNTTLRHSPAYGLYARSIGVALPDFTRNTLTQNALGAAYVDAPIVDYLLDDGTYTGNAIDRVHVNATRPLTVDATWRDLDVPYVLDGGAIGTPILHVQNVTLTIDPGVIVTFDGNMGLNIHRGTLRALGTASDRIVFGGANTGGIVGWRGIAIFEGRGEFAHFTILDGGTSKWGGVNEAGNIAVLSAGQNSSIVAFGPGVQSTSRSQWGLVFTVGPTTGTNCASMAPVYVPPSDTFAQHCPGG